VTDWSPKRREGQEHTERDAKRVRDEYGRRAKDEALHAYYDRNRGALEFASAERRYLVLQYVDRLGPRGETTVLDVGCGVGADLAYLAGHGFAVDHLAGVDLLEERVALARASVPGSDVRVGNAAELPYPDHAFDVVIQSVVLSSVTDNRLRSMIADEMARVVRRGGLLISYDMRTVRPGNAHLTAIDKAELQRLFGGYGLLHVRSLTLNVAIAGRVGSRAAGVLRHLPPLRTHLLAMVIRDARD
jgi:SAM-dependent methyltransferase